jgi:hypothetical protein
MPSLNITDDRTVDADGNSIRIMNVAWFWREQRRAFAICAVLRSASNVILDCVLVS